MKRIFTILISLLAFCVMAGPSLSLEWGPSPDDCIFRISNTNLTASWCVNNYRLYISTNGSGAYHTFNDLGHVTNTVYTQLEAGKHYWFVVTAMNAEGAESDPSNEIDFLIPSPYIRPRPPSKSRFQSAWNGGPLSIQFNDPLLEFSGSFVSFSHVAVLAACNAVSRDVSFRTVNPVHAIVGHHVFSSARALPHTLRRPLAVVARLGQKSLKFIERNGKLKTLQPSSTRVTSVDVVADNYIHRKFLFSPAHTGFGSSS